MARFPWGLSASTSMRYLGSRWADEDRTQTARGYTLFATSPLGSGTSLPRA
jgi:hypothetical protein